MIVAKMASLTSTRSSIVALECELLKAMYPEITITFNDHDTLVDFILPLEENTEKHRQHQRLCLKCSCIKHEQAVLECIHTDGHGYQRNVLQNMNIVEDARTQVLQWQQQLMVQNTHANNHSTMNDEALQSGALVQIVQSVYERRDQLFRKMREEMASENKLSNNKPSIETLQRCVHVPESLKGPSKDEHPPQNLLQMRIFSTEPFTERASTFQGHAATVCSVEEVNAMRNILLQNNKIRRATHNIVAYRFLKPVAGAVGHVVLSDCDDDGETAAGRRLAELLVLLKVENVCVVVSRWFGGILLGPERFKLINQAGRSALELGNFITMQSCHKK